ncbi:MAG: glycosyl transferase [candidate division NC10 bacterium RIFCSPLOWO2_12_FULL_66_18]|nr:MAG: glycosyl transferase [candidate division NC10 bacterium RIFCSPLOWO2_12_FULL_66_18]
MARDHREEPLAADVRPTLSIVIPIFDEEESVPLLAEEIRQALDPQGIAYEVVAVDDGSTDGTWTRLENVRAQDPRWVLVGLRRNFGQTAAMSAGFDHARGDVIVTLDGDLQNDPADIPRLLALAKDFDVVSGWRRRRQDPFLRRRLPSMLANWLISRVTGIRLHDFGCTLKAYRREVVEHLRLYGEMHRFIPAIASWMGISLTEVETHHRARRFGRSKYGIFRTLRVLLDLITVKFLLSFATKPIQVFGLLGICAAGAGFAIGGYLSVLKLAFGAQIGGRPLLFLGILLIVVGVQLIVMGLLGELLVRVYHESQRKPIYMIKRVLGHPGREA